MTRLTTTYARGASDAAAAFGIRTASILQAALPLAGMVAGGPMARRLAGKYAPKMNLTGWKGTALDVGGSMAGQMGGQMIGDKMAPPPPQPQPGQYG
jgi:hypothetical protein